MTDAQGFRPADWQNADENFEEAYDRLVCDNAARLASEYASNPEQLRLAIVGMSETAPGILQQETVMACVETMLSPDYAQTDHYRGYMVDEGLYEQIKECMRELFSPYYEQLPRKESPG